MRRSELYQNTAVGVLVVCAVVITGLVVRRELTAAPTGGATNSSVREIDPKIARELTAHGHLIGPEDAQLKIVEFVDLECPFCAMVEAALAAECADVEGKFGTFIEVVYAAQDSLGVLDWSDFARRAGIQDVGEFEDCVKDARFADRVSEDIAAARRAGVRGTPTFVVGSSVYLGHPSGPGFQELIKRALAEVD